MAESWDEFVAAFVPKVEALKVGDPADDDTDVGPVISEQRARPHPRVDRRDRSGEVLTGGDTDSGRPDPADRDRGPCGRRQGAVRRGVRARRHADEGHVARRGDRARERDALRPAGCDLHRATSTSALEAAQRLEFGGVLINEAPTFRADQMPYGGVKASGNTREGPGLGGARDDRRTPRRPEPLDSPRHAVGAHTPGVLRRERRALLKARAEAVAHIGGLIVELYRRGGFREDLLAERCAVVVGIDARLAEIDELLHVRPECRAANAARRSCAARTSARTAGARIGADAGDATIVVAPVSELLDRREAAVHAVDRTCPHCGAARDADQRYCLECGRALPRPRAGCLRFAGAGSDASAGTRATGSGCRSARSSSRPPGAAIAATVVHAPRATPRRR